MKFKLTNVLFYFRKRLMLTIMRTFIFLFCSTIFGFTPGSLFSQNAKIAITTDKIVTVDEVFDLIKHQTNYTFIYQQDLFKNLPKVQLRKGTIKVGELLKSSVPEKDFDFSFTPNNTIVINEVKLRADKLEQTTWIQVTGVVMNQKKEPLPGVNIKVNGSNTTTQTDFDGKYSVTAPSEGTLFFSYVGHKVEMVLVNNRKVINVTLQEETKELTGVTINTGVTVRKKELITGAVTTFGGEQLRQVSTQNVVQALKSLDPSFIVLSYERAGL